MPKVNRQNILSELSSFLDNESLTIFGPANNVEVFAVLNKNRSYLKYIVCFHEERWNSV